MVVAAPAAASPPSSASSRPKNTCVTSRQNDLPTNLSRRPLNPSEMDNAAFSRRPRAQDITSRYTSSYSCSSSSTSSTSYTSNTTTSSSYSSSSSRRFPSPLSNHRPSTPPKISLAVATKRSQSVDRTGPSTPRLDPHSAGRASASECFNAARTICTTTRSLSVSFQGESFFYQTSKAKSPSPVPVRKTTPERRRPATPSRNSNVAPTEQAENSRPVMELHRWPAARTRRSNLLTESLDCSTENQELLSTVRLLRQSMLFNNGTQRASFDGGQLSSYSDADTVSSGSNSGTPEFNVPRQAKISSRGISIPHRFWQETNTTFRRLPELGMPRSSSGPRGSTTPKLSSIKRSLVDYPIQSPPSAPARLRGPVRPSSPSKLAGSPSPSRVNRTLVISSPAGLPANAPSIISFAAEVRRTKKGENRIEDAHMLRLLHNRHLLWRCVNARANASLMIQRGAAEVTVSLSALSLA
ncbi:hypothetical protein HPP92_023686 [Vanilla planifolia]|uniref:Uncharacterized protein n=1 Tax=Vanilla planifolia TaxID=51239 RepID=A0A835UD32_VANPL|nr:hypothetical protein HPP92_023686 [Vanilla planifolia]